MKFSAKAKRIVALLIVLFLVILAFSSIFLNYVSADTESQLKQQQQNLNANKAGIKGEINELNVQKDNVMAEKTINNIATTINVFLLIKLNLLFFLCIIASPE